MLLTFKKTVEETMEVNVPSWFKTENRYYHLNEQGALISFADDIIITYLPDNIFYQDNVGKALKSSVTIPQEEFDQAFDKVLNLMLTSVGRLINPITQ